MMKRDARIVEIPFLPEFNERMKTDKKTATTRTRKYGERGDLFSAFGEIFEIDNVFRTDLLLVKTYYHDEEGFATPEDFMAVWKRIHPRNNTDPAKIRVWLHLFHRIK